MYEPDPDLFGIPPPPDLPAPPRARRPPGLAIVPLAAVAWLVGSWLALRSLGWFPLPGAKMFFLVGWIPVVGLGLAVGGIKDFRRGWTAGILVTTFALIVPWLAANLVPGVRQPAQYAIPSQPWIALSARPDGTRDLYLMKGDAQHLTAFGETPWAEDSVALSPNRLSIVFSSNRYGNYDLFVMDLDASGDAVGTHRLTDGPGDELSAVWSPEGNAIAYDVLEGPWSTIDVIDAAGGTPKMLTSDTGYAINPAWSADGRSIAFSAPNPTERTDWDIWIMGADGSDPRDAIDATTFDWSPHWSPDGRHLVMTGGSRSNWDVYIASTDGSSIRNITSGSADKDEAYGWSPDGSKVLFISDRSHTGGTFLYFMDPDGANVRLALRI
jgi:Tol biopolymer transport system component